jgi:hypothetical protein
MESAFVRSIDPWIVVIACASLLGCGTTRSDPSPRENAVWSPRITHPFLPLSEVVYAELASPKERVVREVLPETREVAGVSCLVLVESEYEEGELKEISRNFFAQDGSGAVWYFGEEVDEYEGGAITGHDGAWLAGSDGSKPCLFMPARPRIGQRFEPEQTPPHAVEYDEVLALDEELTVPFGRFTGLLVIREGDRPDHWQERKYYARDVGLVSENGSVNLTALRRREAPAFRP